MFDYKPDYEQVRERYLAWWEGEIVDRPLTSICFAKPPEECVAVPPKHHASLRERWLDAEWQAERARAEMSNVVFYADALPVRFPNLGPEIFSAFYGCELEFGPETSWSVPILEDWEPESVARLRLDTDGFYFRKLMELTEALFEVARGRFIVGYTDLHPGGDAIAAFRNPQDLCVDVLTHGEAIRALCDRITDDFLRVYDIFHDKHTAAGMPSTSWLPAICDGKFHIPSNDFSCMVSDEAFETLFLPGIERECAHMDRNIYHLDGPGALRYLDRLLEIPDLHAIQWVPGEGRDDWRRWVHVYRRIRERGRSFTVTVPATELDEFTACLRPEGAWVTLTGIETREEADAALKKIARWGVAARA